MDLFTNFGERISRTAMKSIFGVAPGATKIAAGKPHENTGQSRPRPLALNRFEYFRNNHIEALGSVRRRGHIRLPDRDARDSRSVRRLRNLLGRLVVDEARNVFRGGVQYIEGRKLV